MSSGQVDTTEEVRTIVYDFGVPEMDPQSRPDARTLIFSLAAFYLTVILFASSYASLFNLQSSLHFSSGLGSASLCAIYASSLLSYACLSSLIIGRLGIRRTIALTLTMLVWFFAAHFYPVWYTLIPASLVTGVAAATLWICLPTYLTQAAEMCHIVFKVDMERTLPRLFALCFALVQGAVLVGNVAAYYILRPHVEPSNWSESHTQPPLKNKSFEAETCGADFCWTLGESPPPLLEAPSQGRVSLLCGIFGGGILLAATVAAVCLRSFSDNCSQKGHRYYLGVRNKEGQQRSQSPFQRHLAETLSFAWRTEFQLLAPLTFYQGLELAFVSAEFTKAYVSCSLGVHHVGWTVCIYAVLYMVGSFLLQGPVLLCFGRPALLIFAAALALANLALLLAWSGPSDAGALLQSDLIASSVVVEHAALFLAASGFGIADSALHPQLRALYGLLFCEQKARGFAAMGVMDAMGGLVGFSLGSVPCVRPKIYTVMAALIIGMTAYLVLELKLSRLKREEIGQCLKKEVVPAK